MSTAVVKSKEWPPDAGGMAEWNAEMRLAEANG
jgi:hypothetical protein